MNKHNLKAIILSVALHGVLFVVLVGAWRSFRSDNGGGGNGAIAPAVRPAPVVPVLSEIAPIRLTITLGGAAHRLTAATPQAFGPLRTKSNRPERRMVVHHGSNRVGHQGSIRPRSKRTSFPAKRARPRSSPPENGSKSRLRRIVPDPESERLV